MSVYSVSQVNSYIKNMFAQDFVLNKVSVQGEVSNCKYHSSGHIYFTLKDSGGTLSAIMFASRRAGLPFLLEDGMQVVVTGSVEVYEKGGTYNIYANKIEKAGMGELYEKFLKLKEQLEETGMFAEEYKQPIPKFAKTIGIVTGRTGAALQDIINISTRRNPYVQLVLCPSLVQGAGAAENIARSIRTLDRYGVDVMIVGRGGGSIEDLWAFNDEVVARAIFDCETPVISAVGHETDFTIADYVADLRAPTPSAAAELATIDMAAFEDSIEGRKECLNDAMTGRIEDLRRECERATYRLSGLSPASRVNEYRLATEEARLRIYQGMKNLLTARKHELDIRCERLKGLSPLDKISSGYAWISDASENHLRSVAGLDVGTIINVRFADGKAVAEVKEVEKK